MNKENYDKFIDIKSENKPEQREEIYQKYKALLNDETINESQLVITIDRNNFDEYPIEASVIASQLSDAGQLSENPKEALTQIKDKLYENLSVLKGEKTIINAENTGDSQTLNTSNGITNGSPVSEKKEEYSGEKITQKRLNTNFPGIPGMHDTGALYNPTLYNVKITDVQTGKDIPIYSIKDASRIAKTVNGWAVNGAVGTQFIPNNLLGQFVKNTREHYSPWTCVNALGIYNTEYIRQRVMEFTNANYALDDPEDDYVRNDLTFRNYIHGGNAPRDVNGNTEIYDDRYKTEDKNHNKGWSKFSAHRSSDQLGVGLGECAVLNPPFQFNKRDDPRTNPFFTKIGRVYSTQIMNNWPIVLFQPGRLKYNMGFFKLLGLGGGGGQAVDDLIRTGGGIGRALQKTVSIVADAVGTVATVGSAIFSSGKTVEFKQNINLFKRYVGTLWDELAAIMGLTDEKGRYYGSIPMLTLENVLPIHAMNGGWSSYLNEQFIPFRCSKDVTGQEQFSNQTNENPLMEKFNSIAEENAEEAGATSDPTKTAWDKGKSWVKKKTMDVFGNFSEQAAVMSGRGRITLPDVYASSSFSRSISLTFKFHSPYGDTLSKFENEYIQLLMLLTLGLNRQTGKMTYTSPFAVRVFVKNHIMINCGMIESISVSRGGGDNDWGPDGHPKTLEVSVNIKDMEPNISLPLASRGGLRMALETMFPTSGMSEYLGTIGGLALDEMTHKFRKNRWARAKMHIVHGWTRRFNRDSFISGVINAPGINALVGLLSGVDADVLNKIGEFNTISQDSAYKFDQTVESYRPGFYFQNTARNGLPEGFVHNAKQTELNIEESQAFEFDNSD